MLRYFAKRTGAAIATLLVLSLLIFAGSEMLPGDVAEVALGQSATPESLQALRLQLGLDRPAPERYLTWLSGAARGDWGLSVMTRVPVADLLTDRLANTTVLALTTAAIAVPLAVILGIFMAFNPGGRFDKTASSLVLAISATPEFLIATILVLLFAVYLRWFPAVSYFSGDASIGGITRTLALPVATLVLISLAQMSRMTRAALINAQDLPFIEMAQLKGLTRTRTIFVHAFVAVSGPIINVVALNLAYLISGIVVVETIFSYPGLARLMIDAVTARDLPVVQACAMLFCVAYVVLMMIADLLAMVSNPKLRSML